MKTTKIEWCDHTWNAWIGCQKVSPGCVNCYAAVNTFTRVQRAKGRELWGPTERHHFPGKHWNEPHKWNTEAKKAGVRRRVFCGSMMDVFERPKNPDTLASLNFEREKLWLLIDDTPDLDWLLLTKRPENASECLPSDWLESGLPKNIWMGTTVEDQRRCDERVPHLLKIPAAVRFLSCEPLLDSVELRGPWEGCGDCDRCTDGAERQCSLGYWLNCLHPDGIQWVIVGGESGGGARPMQLDWMRQIVLDCANLGVACFAKQFGARPMDIAGLRSPALAARSDGSYSLSDSKGAELTEIPGDWPRQFPR
jgi:protein gp37